MLSIQTYTPKKLAAYIHSLWYMKVPEGLSAPYIENILPDGHQEIIFHLNTVSLRKRNYCDNWQKDPAVYFAGQNRKSYTQVFDPGAIIYGVRFHAHTQYLFYPHPASVFTGQVTALEDLFPKDTLVHCIGPSPDKTFEKLEKELMAKAKSITTAGTSYQYVDAAIRKILQQKGIISNTLLEKITGVSARHLEKSFHQYVGLAPRQFSNIIQYSYFVNYRNQHPNKLLTECAYEAGFCDQSHLIRSSHRYSGLTPKAFFKKRHYINEFFLQW